MSKLTNKIHPKILEMVMILTLILAFFLLSPLFLGVLIAQLVSPLPLFLYRYFHIPFFVTIVLLFAALLFSIIQFLNFAINCIYIFSPVIQQAFIAFNDLLAENNLLAPLVLNTSMLVQGGIEKIVHYASNSFKQLFYLVLFLFAFILALYETKHNPNWLFTLFPASIRVRWENYFYQSIRLLRYFFFVELVLLTVTFCILLIAFHLLAIEHAFYLAFLLAIADLLPLFGLGIYFIPITIYYFLINNYFLMIAHLTLYILLIIIRQLIESKLWASTFHIRTVYSFLIGAASIMLFGFYGLLLSPFIMLIAVRFKNKHYF